MTAARKIVLTHHAIEQYRERWRPDLSVDAAGEALAELSRRLVRSDDRTTRPKRAGRESNLPVWEADGVRFIIGDNGKCVTILPPRAEYPAGQADPWGAGVLRPEPPPDSEEVVAIPTREPPISMVVPAMHLEREWIQRPYIAEDDEHAVMYQALKSYAHSYFGASRGAHRDGRQSNREAERSYWNDMAPVFEWLLRSPHVDVAVVCDSTRPRRSEAGPAVLWGFAITSGDVIHYVSVKRTIVQAGLGPEIVDALLGARLQRACTYTLELTEMRTGKCGVSMPRCPDATGERRQLWVCDPSWFARMLLPKRCV